MATENPYLSPVAPPGPLDRNEPQHHREPRPLAVAAMALSGVLGSGFFGATTNAINGAVSPTYFVNILGWHGVENVWRASIVQGVFEGLLFGVFFSLVFTVSTGIITGATCSFGFAFRHMLGIFSGAVCLLGTGRNGRDGTGDAQPGVLPVGVRRSSE